MSAPKKRGLGRGLEALLGPKAAATPPPEAQPGEVLRQIGGLVRAAEFPAQPAMQPAMMLMVQISNGLG